MEVANDRALKKGSPQVGYKRPPKHSQFRKGQSGNPKGRPKGAKGFAAELQQELDEIIPVREGGRERRLSKRRVIIKRMVEAALKGEPKAIQAIARAEPKPDDQAHDLSPAELTQDDQQILERFFNRHRSFGGPRK